MFKFLKLWTLNDWASHLKALSDFQVIPSDSAFRFSFFEVLSQKFWHKRQTTFTVSDRSVHWTPSTNVAVPLGLSTDWKVGCLLSLNNAGESRKLISLNLCLQVFKLKSDLCRLLETGSKRKLSPRTNMRVRWGRLAVYNFKLYIVKCTKRCWKLWNQKVFVKSRPDTLQGTLMTRMFAFHPFVASTEGWKLRKNWKIL